MINDRRSTISEWPTILPFPPHPVPHARGSERRRQGALVILVVIGVASVFLATTAYEPERLWQGLLFNWLFWSSLAIGMVMFAVALHITNADWAWSIQRFALGGVAFLPISLPAADRRLLRLGDVLPPLAAPGRVRSDHRGEAAWLTLPTLIARDFIAVIDPLRPRHRVRLLQPPAGRLRRRGRPRSRAIYAA
jgi:hypothetical protein